MDRGKTGKKYSLFELGCFSANGGVPPLNRYFLPKLWHFAMKFSAGGGKDFGLSRGFWSQWREDFGSFGFPPLGKTLLKKP